MKLFQKALSLLLSLILVSGVFLALPAVSHADEAAPVIKGTFTMGTFDGFDPGVLDYYYSDNYFSASGKETDPHLRTMSSVLAFSCRGTSKTPAETYGRILTHIGFTDIETYDMDHTSMDSLGVVLARKTIGDKDVVAVAIRGDAYNTEMAANLIAGDQGDISAFADAESLVESRVTAYLSTHGISAAKLWVVGYSRAGAVANLFGREVNKDLSGFCTTDDDVYVYTFEAPLSSADNTVYENIHNIIDKRDLVTYVYPAIWSLYNNGVPEYIGDTNDMISLKTFSFTADGYIEDKGKVKTVDYLKDLVDFLGTNIPRKTFAEKLQTPVSKILEIFYTLSSAKQSEVIEYFRQVLESAKGDSDLMTIALTVLLMPNADSSAQKVTDLLTKHMDLVAAQVGNPFSDDDYTMIKSMLKPIIAVLLPVLYQDFTAEYDFDSGPEAAGLYHFLTLFGNLTDVICHHYNYKVFYELAALDWYYSKRVDAVIGDVDGDGDVTIFDATRIQRWLAEIADIDGSAFSGAALTAEQIVIADVDKDNAVTVIDATAIQRYLAMLPTEAMDIGKPIM